jgi:hypothetical protein
MSNQDLTEEEIKNEELGMHLLLKLRSGKQVYEMFQANFRSQYLIAGKPIYKWEQEFKIHIPEDSSPAKCKELDIKLLELHERATFFRASARAILQALKSGSESELNTAKNALVMQYEATNKKLPAAATLESMAAYQIKDVDGALMSANIASEFWSDIIDHLAFCRKILENISINNGIEAKSTKGY